MTLFDAFLVSVSVYFMTALLFRLQGSDAFKGLPLTGHFLVMLPVWMFFTFAVVFNSDEKSTTVLGTIILVVQVAILFLTYFTNTFQSFGKSADLARMILKYDGDYMNPQIVHEIYRYCCKHELLSPVVRKHNADIGNFGLVYLLLLASCPVKVKGHFIPISTFFFANSLDYVLSKDFLSDEDIGWLKRYFGAF